MHNPNILAAAGLALLVASPALSQGALSGFDAVDDRIADIQDDASDVIGQADRDTLGPLGVPQGWNGSLALTGAITTGNTDTSNLSAAARLTYGTGLWSHSFGFAAEFAEEGGDRSRESYYATYEASRALTESYYAFGLARAEYDAFASNEVDGFVGAGLGFNVPMGPDVTWRIQAGPGARFVRDADGVEVTETALLIGSRYSYAFSDMVSLTNDTDVLGSETNIVANNELGLNFRMSDALATRVSYRTSYNSDPLPGLSDVDNTLGVAVVLGF